MLLRNLEYITDILMFLFRIVYFQNRWMLTKIWEMLFWFAHTHSTFGKSLDPHQNFINPCDPCNFLTHPCSLQNLQKLADSFEIGLIWKLKHIILEVVWPETSEIIYYRLTKTLIKSVHIEVVCISQNMLGYTFAVKINTSDKNEIHEKKIMN